MASDGLTQFHDYAEGLLTKISPSARKELAKQIALNLRSENRKRITAQIQPDGTKFTPRKKKGRIKQKMFTKLRTAKYLKMKANPNNAVVNFIGNAGSIARVHHYGLRDRIDRDKNVKVTYPKRELLGITEMDRAMIEDLVIEYLSKN